MIHHRPILFVCLLLASVFAVGFRLSIAQDKGESADKKNKDTIDKLASKLPRVPASEPGESLKKIQRRDGFLVELVAAEPLVRDPVAIDFDEYGRAFVVELPQYNGYAVEGFKGHGSVRMLEDGDGDGRYDKSTIYADNLDYPTAVACWDGGLFIGAAPDLLYVKDSDGDGKADTSTVVFTGFGKDKAGEAHLNSFRWSFDNRFHFSTNLSGGDIRVVADDESKPVSVRGRGMIFDPRDLSGFELTSGGGQHGMSMDNWGHKFVCSNSVPAQMLMYDDRYLTRNPHARAPAAAVDIAPQGKFTRLFRISPDEPWRKLRTRLRKEGKFRGSDEGGKPFGFFTGATGITVYRGDAWPKEYRGDLLVGDVANNLIYRANLRQDGLRLVAHRADADAEFLASSDIWFRPVQMANAPDGTLYVLDIYRGLIEGAAFLPPEFIKYLDPVSGNDRGRIYRIAPQGFENAKPPNLGDASTEELVAFLDHRNGWHRDTASRLLYQRQDRRAIAPLRRLAAKAESPEGRMCALYSLDGLEALDEELVSSALDDQFPIVRAHALPLAEAFAVDSAAIVAKMCSMIGDDDLRVRYQLAFSLGAVSTRKTNSALAKMVVEDGQDSWMRLAVFTSLHEGAGQVFAELNDAEAFRKTSHGSEFLSSLTEQIGTANRKDEIAVVIRTLQELTVDEKAFAQKLVEALVKNQKGADRERILAAASGKAGEILAELLDEAQRIALDEGTALPERVEAINSLKLAPLAEVQTLLGELLDLRQAGEVQSAALHSLGEFPDDQVAKVVLQGWRGYSPNVRAEATETLLSRPAWIASFLDAVEEGGVSRGDVDPARIGLLKKHPDGTIAKRASQLFGDVGLSQRGDIVQRYQIALSAEGDAKRGKQIFKKTCSACHQLEGVGTAVGADLKAIRNRGVSAVMLNILDPNREVKPKFLTYVLITDDGKSITGMIQSENANSLTIRRPDGTKIDVQRSEIDELRSTGLSFMPEGLEKQVDVKAMADLLAYLDSIR
jgi:putative membrane-bound dehydrogenase-like protein